MFSPLPVKGDGPRLTNLDVYSPELKNRKGSDRRVHNRTHSDLFMPRSPAPCSPSCLPLTTAVGIQCRVISPTCSQSSSLRLASMPAGQGGTRSGIPVDGLVEHPKPRGRCNGLVGSSAGPKLNSGGGPSDASANL